MDTCLKKITFGPSGLRIPAFIFFFPCPSGPRIPAFNFFSLPIGAVDTCLDFFFSHCPSGPFMDGSVVFCGSLSYLECLQIYAANRLVLCEWTYGFGWEMTLQLG